MGLLRKEFGVSSTENQHQGGNADELYYWEPYRNLQLTFIELDEVMQFWCSSLHSHLNDKQEGFKSNHLWKVTWKKYNTKSYGLWS